MITLTDVNRNRIMARIRSLSEIGRAESGGYYRYTFSEAHVEATRMVAGWMAEAGLTVGYDQWRNLYGRTPATATTPSVMSGSHLDSVPNGGNFDGPLGVLTALEAVQTIMERGIDLSHPLEVVSFIEEEGARFVGLLGSQLATGQFRGDPETLMGMDGIPFVDALRSAQFPMPTVTELNVSHFVELHIEQGKRLERAGIPIGVVTTIAGPIFKTIHLYGRSDHAGATAYEDRQDTLLAAAEIIVHIRKLGKERFDGHAHMTVGKINAYPNVTNVVAGKTSFDIDYRAVNVETQREIDIVLEDVLNKTSAKYGLTWEQEYSQVVPATPISNSVQEAIRAGGAAAGLQTKDLISWAAHDAMLMANVAEIGMIFVPCRDGRSHTPEEFVNEDDIAAGVAALTNTLIALAT